MVVEHEAAAMRRALDRAVQGLAKEPTPAVAFLRVGPADAAIHALTSSAKNINGTNPSEAG